MRKLLLFGIVEFDLKRTDDIQEFKIYTKLEEERIYCKGSITKKENTATYYTIDIININENGKEYKRKYEYGTNDSLFYWIILKTNDVILGPLSWQEYLDVRLKYQIPIELSLY